MKTSDFDYDLPPELIAQQPIEPRDASRMMVVQRQTGALAHRCFRDLPDYLCPGDVLVLNRTRVLPARIWARKAETGGRIELLLLRCLADGRWEVLVRGRRARPGTVLEVVSRDGLPTGRSAVLHEERPSGARVVQFAEPPEAWLAQCGEMPLPPYIHERLEDQERYQTVYGDVTGSAAAPTAGLHFTPATIERLGEMGVGITYVTLHVGLDTFRPVHEEDVEQHAIHSEWCELDAAAAAVLSRARAEGRRVVAVGTTAVRVLETAAAAAAERQARDPFVPYAGDTRLFIYPGYRFRAVDATLTNFHLPRSTLLMLVAAFAGRDLILRAYEEAVRERYRFFSFGDCMLLV
ncbi:MAG: tRNA preQ1(34) S-adenosylmethionine ribosyltransferase-isomerase QueA [Anaerolineae bacterium]